MSKVWDYFRKKKINGKHEAICEFPSCGSKFQIINYGTSSLIKHLLVHGIDLSDKRSLEPLTSGPSKVQKTSSAITSFVTRESRSLLLAKCAAKDGFSVSQIISSDACKAYLTSRNFQMPWSRTTVWNEIEAYYNQVLENFKGFITESKQNGRKFSLLIDEWTDISSQRYLNINLHNGIKAFQYCLAPIGYGSCNSNRLRQIVLDKLADVGIDTEKDVVASTHDGASTMRKYGSLMPFEQQLCLNHALNLAIVDVLYKQENHDETESEAENIEIIESDDEDLHNEALVIEIQRPLDITGSYKDLISQVRKYVKIFRKSPLKLAQLKKNTMEKIGKELTLLLDCKTRWNSVLPMLKRFDQLKDIIEITLAEYNFNYDSSINLKIGEIIKSLTPIEESILKLGSSSCDLLVAEATCIYLLSTLKDNNSRIGRDLYVALKRRIEERRNMELISVFLFLHSGEYPKENQFFKYSSKGIIKKKIKELATRLFSEELVVDNRDVPIQNVPSSSLDEVINHFLNTESLPQNIENDIKAFEGTKERTGKLDQIYDALKTIQATSTTVERTFSVAGNFKTKVRNSMKPKNLDILVHLKYHFLNQ